MRELLDCNLLTSLTIPCRDDRAVRALADELDRLVLHGQLEHDASEVGAGETGDLRGAWNASCLLLGADLASTVVCLL